MGRGRLAGLGGAEGLCVSKSFSCAAASAPASSVSVGGHENPLTPINERASGVPMLRLAVAKYFVVVSEKKFKK